MSFVGSIRHEAARNGLRNPPFGEDVSGTLEVILRDLKVIQTVREKFMNQRRQALVVKKSFQRVQASHQLIGRRRHIARVIQRAAWRSDPILAAPEFSGCCRIPAHAPHEPLVDLADQAQG